MRQKTRRILNERSYFWRKEINEHRFSRNLQETVINSIFSVKLIPDASRDAKDDEELLKKLKFEYTISSIENDDSVIFKLKFDNPTDISMA